MQDASTKLLTAGVIGVIPTDTVYGVVARAEDKLAVERLYKLKARQHKPGTVIAANIEQLVGLGIKRRYLKAVEQFWPGPVSVEIPHSITYLNLGTGRQAFRIPKGQKIHDLLVSTGPLQTTSANPPGKPIANTIKEARHYFGDQVDFYEDGGNLSNNLPSTIVRVIDDAIEVVREGAAKIDS